MALVSNPKSGDDISVRQAIAKLGSSKLGPTSTPKYAGLTLTGLTVNSLVYPIVADDGTSTGALTSLGAATDGQLPIGDTDGIPVLANITGTAKQVIVTNGAGTIALSGPQDLDTVDSPTFAGGTFTGVVTGIIPTAGVHFATKEYVDLAGLSGRDYWMSDTDDSVIADYHMMYPAETGDAQSTEQSPGMSAGDNQLMFSFITEAGEPGFTQIRSGVYSLHTHLHKGSGDPTTVFYWTLSKRLADSPFTETLLMTSETSGEIDATTPESFITHANLSAEVAIGVTDRLVLKFYGNVTGGGTSEVTITMEGSHDCHLSIQAPSSIWQNQGDVLDDFNTLGAVASDGQVIVGTGSGVFAYESGATLRTSIGVGTGDSPTFANLSIGTGELTCGSINRASGTLTLEVGGTAEVSITSSAVTLGGNLVGPNGFTIGSVGDTDVMTIDASGNCTFSVFPITPSAAPDANYEVANKKYVDDNAEGTDEKCKVDSGATEGYLGAASNDGILRSGPSLSYTDGGDYVTLNAIPGMFLDFYLSATLEGVIATYYDMYDQPTGGGESTKTNVLNPGDDQLLVAQITESGQPGIVELRAGIYSAHIHAAKTVGANAVTTYWTLSTRTTGDSETVRMTSEVSGTVAGSNTEYELRATLATNVTINSTDRLVWKLYANVAA